MDPCSDIFKFVYDANVEALEKALRNGADPNVTNGMHVTPIFHIRSIFHNFKCLPVLLRYGADINYRNPRGWTPLSFAVNMDDQCAIKILIENGADPNSTMPDGIPVQQHEYGYAILCYSDNSLDIKGALE